MGLAEGPDGSLYVSETEKGAIWKIEFKGDKERFGAIDLLKMKMRETLPHFKTPDAERSRIMMNETPEASLYNTYCATCHQRDGMGDMSRFPPLSQSEWVIGDKEVLISIILNGQEGEMKVLDRMYNNVMPKHDFLSDEQISNILSYIRTNFQNEASKITAQEVAEARAKLSVSAEESSTQ
jgi:cytochrome c